MEIYKKTGMNISLSGMSRTEKYSLTGVRTTKIPSSDQNILPQIELRGIIINPTSEREIGTEQLLGRIEKLFNETEYISFMLFDYNLLMNSVR